ncbi:MAG: glycoside hydrolase family 95 protein [Ruminococcus sp.]|nr:glycoside hydrolase family 95 protein [Ruminococcus sp.]MDE7104432.1 glycoside hydrolase family 95 protein [Ruminococcus sp.]
MSETLLKYNKPAENFNEALPIGNGRIGGMIFGRPAEEIIKLNEDSVWSGGLRHRVNPDAQEGLAEVRELLKIGDIPAAEKIAFEKLQGVTPDMRRYMPLGNLYINNKFSGKAKEYSRTLDISTAVSSVRFTADEKQFTRNIFCSAPDEVMVIDIHGDTPASITMDCFLDGRDGYYDDNRPCGKNMLMYTGGTGSKDGIFFAVCLGAKADGGEICTVGGKISIKNADSVMLVLSVKTSFYTENYIESAEIDAEMALQCSYDELYFRHVSDYQSLFERVEFSLNDNGDSNGENPAEMNTNERIARLKGDEMDSKDCERLIHDNKLMELYFNFGRYLMISASRNGTQPMNLQGIWNEDMIAPWGSKYTTNINTEMNYWCAESCNLSECHLPLFELLERVCKNGKITAKEMYGINKGYVCHHNTDIWGDTAPQDLYMPATIWVTGGAWLALHVFEHYEYTLDKDFLEEKYHLLKESAEFFLNYLIEDNEGRLVTCPSVSPENTYLTDKGVKGCLCIGPSMDSQIITVLFNDVIKAAGILGKDKTFIKRVEKALEKLPKPEIGKYGQIKEWAVDYDEVEAGHRHVSQLFALHPADLITPSKTPKLANAARATLVRRLIHGGGHTGWSCAWIANMWARLYDSRMVYENLKKLLTYSTNPNMTCNHPPFQIAGNFGGVSAIVESILQCTSGEIIILPALPDEWQEGYIKGLRAKGGFGIDIEWSEGKLKSASIISDYNSECRLRLNCIASIICEGETVCSRIEDGTIIFNTMSGKKYTVRT